VEGQAPLRILGATAYPVTAASARVRVAQYVPFLRPHGVELTFEPALRSEEYATLASDAAALRKVALLAASALRAARSRRDGELLLVHRLRLLNPLPGVDPPPRLDAYDLDDALFTGSAAEVNRRFQWAKQEARRSIACIRRARLVIAGNAFLAAEAGRYARRVEVVPSCVDPSIQPVRDHGAAEVVTIGWIGSHTTSAYLAPILPVLARLNEPRLRARLVVVGGSVDVKAPWIEQRPWSLERQPADLAGFDVGIMPLPDTEWARGKCGYKLLQYFAAGVPAVASPVGVSRELVGTDHGLLATTTDEWHTALDRLIRDAAERAERGAAARGFVEREFSYARWAPELAAMLRSLA
jgi:glycosyltransferase involved in cell wall biosynthesis